MKVGADSSFLVSCYVFEVRSDAALEFLATHAGQIFVSPITVLEVTNGLKARVFRGKTTEEQARIALADFGSDMASGTLRQAPMPPSVWIRAKDLALAHTSTTGTRSLDILHVAFVLEIRAHGFLTFDRTQARLAHAEGLATPIPIL
jgi:predicted nucleic acid-binding protein